MHVHRRETPCHETLLGISSSQELDKESCRITLLLLTWQLRTFRSEPRLTSNRPTFGNRRGPRGETSLTNHREPTTRAKIIVGNPDRSRRNRRHPEPASRHSSVGNQPRLNATRQLTSVDRRKQRANWTSIRTANLVRFRTRSSDRSKSMVFREDVDFAPHPANSMARAKSKFRNARRSFSGDRAPSTATRVLIRHRSLRSSPPFAVIGARYCAASFTSDFSRVGRSPSSRRQHHAT